MNRVGGVGFSLAAMQSRRGKVSINPLLVRPFYRAYSLGSNRGKGRGVLGDICPGGVG